MGPSERIRLGQIGCGNWGKKLNGYFALHPGFEMAKVSAKDASKPREGLTGSFTDIRGIIDDRQIEAVIVATPVETHFELAKQVLSAGKHLFCEKNFTVTPEEAEELKRLAASRSLKIMVDYTFTFSRGIAEMLRIARSGVIGNLSSVSMRMCISEGIRKESAYSRLASHILSILSMLHPLGEFSFSRHDMFIRDRVVDKALLMFKHGPSQLNGSAYLNLNDPDKSIGVSIFGETGVVTYDAIMPPAVRTVEYASGNESCIAGDESNNLAIVVDLFHRMLTSDEPSNIDRALQVAHALKRIDDLGRSS